MLQRVLKDKELQELYLWVDSIPLSRPKRNMARDFSDAGTFWHSFSACCLNNFTSLTQNRITAQLHFYWQSIDEIVELENTQLYKFDQMNEEKVLKKLKIITALANCEALYAQKLIALIKKSIEEQPQLSQISRVTKSSKFKQIILPLPAQQRKQKVLTFKQILKNKQVKEIVTNKDQQIQTLKQTLQLYALKFSKLDEIVKSKDRQIEELVKKIKNKGIM